VDALARVLVVKIGVIAILGIVSGDIFIRTMLEEGARDEQTELIFIAIY
jgi:hypothetical protein